MRYFNLSTTFFQNNRKRFAELMQNNCLAIITGNDAMPNNADDLMGYTPNNDMFYLSGIEQEQTILVVYPNAVKENMKEILFVKDDSNHNRQWDGDILSKEQAQKISGIKNVLPLSAFEKTLQLIAFEANGVYLGHNEHIKRATAQMQTKQDRMIEWVKEKYPLHALYRAAQLTRQLRVIKQQEEIDLIRKANQIAQIGFNRVLNNAKPGVYEYQLEAEYTYEMLKNGGRRHSFLPILASGKNACTLHYNTNNEVCNDGDLILMDFGTCYGNYNSDTTRCFPINGKFTQRQKEVYQSVLHCLNEGSKMLKPGVMHADYEKNMASLVEGQLIALGVLSKEEVERQDPGNPAYRKYFMHGTAHHIGLDVHDVGDYNQEFKEGMVLTCEPGIYIPEESIGVRLENDYLIIQDGNSNLSEGMPIEIDEIEQIMNA